MEKSKVCLSVLIYSVLAVSVLILPGAVMAATYFQDDFNSYTTNAALWAVWPKANLNQLFLAEGASGGGVEGDYDLAENADWQLNSLFGNRTNPPTRDGSPSSGQSIACDSDKAGSGDGDNYNMGYAITSPAFSTTGAGSVFLHFSCDATLNEPDGTCFEVYASNDNGTTWTMVFQRINPGRWRYDPPLPTTDNADGIYGVVDLNITAVAANKSQVKVRFICRGNSDGWFTLIDDVVVDNIDLENAGTTVLLPTETFSSVPDGQIPAGWTRQSGCDENPWQVGDLTRYYTNSDVGGVWDRSINRLDTKFAIFDSDKDPDSCPDNEFLVTPAINTTGVTLVYLIFDSEIVQNAAANERVEVSTDNGTTWRAQPAWTYQGKSEAGNETNYLRHVVPVFGVNGFPQVRFRFAYTGPGDSWFWAIDNVTVKGGQGDLPPAAPSVTNARTSFYLDEAKSPGGLTGFSTSAFNPTSNETHGRTDYQVIRINGNFDSPMVSGSVNAGDLTQFAITGLAASDTFLVRARHVTVGGTPGPYGPSFTFSVGGPQGTASIFCENFDSLASVLKPASDELNCTGGITDLNNLGWTHQTPAGWSIDNSQMGAVGTLEWQGWSFATMSFWTDADGQQRGAFALSNGVLAITDPDEWDDCNSPAGQGSFDSTLLTPSIPVPANTPIQIIFDSHYRQEDPAEVSFAVSFNGGADEILMHYCCQGVLEIDGGGDNDGVDVQNANLQFTLPPRQAASNMVMKWRHFNAGNNWFWGIDNVCVYIDEALPVQDWTQY